MSPIPIEPRDQEHAMTTDPQRRHDVDQPCTVDQTQPDDRTRTEKSLDLIADHLRDVLLELRVGNSHDLLAEIRDALTGDKQPDPEAVEDVIAEPPCGSQVTDREGDVWEQVGAGWQPWDRTASMWGGRAGWGSKVGPRAYAPLRFTTDADRERVGLPVDTAPDVDPDEEPSSDYRAAITNWARERKRLTDRAEVAEEQEDHWQERCQRAEADVERLTRELKQAGSRPCPPTEPTQERAMTTDPQRRHDELVALLTEIRDRLPKPEGVKDGPTYITEEPPVGSQVTDRQGDIWERREEGWALWWPERAGWIADLYQGELDPWSVARNQAPLRFTTDADRKRVGLPERPTRGAGMSLSEERLAEIRAKLDEQDFDWDYPFDVAADDLLTEVDRLTAENARLRAESLARSQFDKAPFRNFAWRRADLLNPPTEGETDRE